MNSKKETTQPAPAPANANAPNAPADGATPETRTPETPPGATSPADGIAPETQTPETPPNSRQPAPAALTPPPTFTAPADMNNNKETTQPADPTPPANAPDSPADSVASETRHPETPPNPRPPAPADMNNDKEATQPDNPAPPANIPYAPADSATPETRTPETPPDPRQPAPTAMNSDKETTQPADGAAPETPPHRPRRTVLARQINPTIATAPQPTQPRPAALTPPPPSAPAEFLQTQNPLAPDTPDTPAPPTLTPPPPSAPAEFLNAQQPAPIPEVKTPTQLMQDFLHPPAPPETQPTPEAPPQPTIIRGLILAQDERIIKTLQPDNGMTEAPPTSGPSLILTNRRLIAFRGSKGYRDTQIALLTGITQFSVHTGQRNWSAIAQGILLIAAGALLYGIVGYWLAGQFSGPNIPALNIDLAPLIALLVILAGLLILLQNYFTRPAGAIIFRGPGLELAFPIPSALPQDQIYGFLYLTQSAARRATPEPQPHPP